MSNPLTAAENLLLVVDRIATAGTDIREIILKAADGGGLPAWDAGAHIRVAIPGGARNAYSLVDHGDGQPGEYRLGVRLDANGAGGSRFMHGLQSGDSLEVTPPRNEFALDGGDTPALLLGGGIGITPLISMAQALQAQGREWQLHYAARNAKAAAFADRLAAHGARFALHCDDTAGGPLPVANLIAAAAPGTHVYICGPRPMIDAARRAAEAAGLPAAHFHTELFDAPVAEAGDRAFEVEINSGQVFTVAPGQTIIAALEAGGIDIVYDCQRGDCGICQVEVLEGTPDHRDVVLSEAERAGGKVMQICVSRALSARLKLDI